MSSCQEYDGENIAEEFTENHLTLPKIIPETIIKYLSERNSGIEKNSDGKPVFEFMLDAGCGGGRSTRLFTEYFHNIRGFDISKNMIAQALQTDQSSNIQYVIGSGESIPAENSSADLITSCFSVQNMDVDKFICECRRVLKPKGCVALYGYEKKDIRLDCSGSETELSGMKIWKSYEDKLHHYIFSVQHPQKDVFDRYQAIYDRITMMKKNRNDEITSITGTSLEGLVLALSTIPIYKKYHETMGSNLLENVAKKLKEFWKIPSMNNRDVQLAITHSLFIVYLTK